MGFPYLDPPKIPLTPRRIFFKMCSGLAIRMVPAADDQQLRRLEQHPDITVLHQVAANDGSDYHHDSNDDEHNLPRLTLG